MTIVVTIREALHTVSDFYKFCIEFGLNPYCMNEGTATGDEQILLDEEQAIKYGFLKD